MVFLVLVFCVEIIFAKINNSFNQVSTGEMRVYFNKSVDINYSRFQQTEKTNIFSKFVQRINSAKYSIDLCFYSISESESFDAVADLLINAYQNGVKIRVIYEADNENTVFQQIKNAGIPIINDRFGNNNGQGLMHNKFVIIDHRDKTSATDDWIWTGSYNLSYNGTFLNAENVIEIQDQALAECYTIEFNEMWGSETDTPNPSQSKFGNRKSDNSPHVFNINGIEVLQFMSPSDNVLKYIVGEIAKAQNSLYFCIFNFTHDQISDVMYQKWMTVDNFKIKGVFDDEQLSSSEYYKMNGTGSQAWNPPADVLLDKETALLHHKYLIIDGNGGPGQPVLITGSYNWSYSAENNNDENILIIKDATIANLYFQEFAARYHNAGGTDNLTYTSIEKMEDKFVPTTTYLYQNYPNPFNYQTIIEISIAVSSEIAVEIFNIAGQRVQRFDLGFRLPGQYQISWDGYNELGDEVAGGIYLYRLNIQNSGKEFEMKKMIYLP